MLASIKSRIPSYGSEEVGHTVNLKATRKTALAISGSDEEEVPTSRRRVPSPKGKGKSIDTPSHGVEVP